MIYVLAIRKNLSGGSETLHQFAAMLVALGQESVMHYPDAIDEGVPDKFQKYGVISVNSIIDDKENILIVPETETKYLYNYKHIKKCIWWLALDNYYGFTTLTGLIRSAQRHNIPRVLYPIYIPTIFIKKKLTPKYFRFKKSNDPIFHLYNCEYVHRYLIKKGIEEDKCLYMCGPISDEYFNVSMKSNKQNIVVYNPKKNLKFTKLVIRNLGKKRKDIQCIAIDNMTPNQIVSLLDKAKVYIDFGQFPGPERIPREAVTRKCNIITSKFGSAANNEDVPIPQKYKFEARKKNLNDIVDTIEELCDNYEIHISEYNKYRKKVSYQRTLLADNSVIFVQYFKHNS